MQSELIEGEAQYPLQVIEFDHLRLNVEVIDEKTGMVLGRPWLTIGVDSYSQAVWSIHVSLEPPSANTIGKAIEFGLFPKHAKERYGTENEWGVFGIPHSIRLQSCHEFRNVWLIRNVQEYLGISFEYVPVTRPPFGAQAERWLRLLFESNYHYKPEPNQEVIFTLDKLRGMLATFITDVYHMTVNKNLPPDSNIPAVRYKDGVALTGPRRMVTPDNEEAVRFCLLPTVMRPYTRNGVRFQNIQYRTDSLSYLAVSPYIKHDVKYDVDDVSRIYLRPEGTQEYVVVPAVEPAAEVLADVNAYTWGLVRGRVREQGPNYFNTSEDASAIEQHLTGLVQQDSMRKRKSVGGAAKWHSPDSLSVTPPDGLHEEMLKRVGGLHVTHPQYKGILEMMHMLRKDPYLHPRILFVTGERGVGKTRLVTDFMNHPLGGDIRHREKLDEISPILYVESPFPFTVSSLYDVICRGLGGSTSSRRRMADLQRTTFTFLENHKVEVVVIDEVDHIFGSSHVKCKEVMEAISHIVTAAGVSIALVGTPDIENLRTLSPRLEYLSSVSKLGRFEDCDEEFCMLLSQIENKMEIPVTLELGEPETLIPQLLYNMSSGLLGVLVPLLQRTITDVVTQHGMSGLGSRELFLNTLTCVYRNT